MFQNFFKVAYRSLLKNKVPSFINLFGLTLAIGCAVTCYLFVEMRYSMDDFHEHAERIFYVENIIDRDGSRQLWGDAPMPLGPALQADFPQVEQVTRVAYGGGTMQYGDRVFREGVFFVDPNFLDVLTFPLKYGNEEALADPNAIVVGPRVAERYFGEANPVGRQVTIEFGDRYLESFTVAGVAEDFPENASFNFNILINYEKQLDVGVERLDDWAKFTAATFILLKDPGDIEAIAAGMDRYRLLQNAANQDWPIAAFAFDNLLDLSLRSPDIRGDISSGPPPMAAITMGLIGLFMLALACFNYMNIAIATASRRLKEIGVRKVVGSSKLQLVVQFLGENILLCMIALVLGTAVAAFLLAPGFNHLFAEIGMPALTVSLTENASLWLVLLALLLLTGIAGGAYPAFYVSTFKPVSIFRGRQEVAGRRLFSRVFLTFQFVLAFITMISGVILTQNAEYQAARDWGYAQANTLVVPLEEAAQYEMLKSEVARHPSVVGVAGSQHHVGRGRGYAVLDIRDEKMESVRFDVGHGYLETLGLRLAAGRLFDEAHGGDATGAIVINELFARNAGWDDPVGQQVRLDSTAYTVVGVVEDFHYSNFFEEIQPVFFHLAPEEGFRWLTLRVVPGAGMQTAAFVEERWKQLIPDAPYNGFFQDTIFDRFYRESRNISTLFAVTALMALVISCMGLFGLAAQNVARRMKEISIRKVLGASVVGVTSLVNRGFLLLLALAAVIATPLSYVMVGAFLDGIFEYRMPIGPLPFVLAFLLVFVTATLTVSSQFYRIAVANPAEVLRNE